MTTRVKNRGGGGGAGMLFWPGCCCKKVEPTIACPGPCGTVWPERLYITDMHGTHPIDWNSGVGWIGCYTFDASASDLFCDVAVGPVMVRYGLSCPTLTCDRVNMFYDYEIKDCNFALGAYHLSRYKACGDIVNRNWIQQSDPGTYTMSPVYAEWTGVPSSRLEFGTTYSPLPVHGTIILSE